MDSTASPARNRDSSKQLINNKVASQQEADECFNDALTSFERAGTHVLHLPRVTMKHLLGSTHQALQQYCANFSQLKDFWVKYLVASRNYRELIEFCRSPKVSSPGASYIVNTLTYLPEENYHDTFPELIKEFTHDSDTNKWFDDKKINLMIDSLFSQEIPIRIQLTNVLHQHTEYNNWQETSCLGLCLGLKRIFLDHARKVFDLSSYLNIINKHGTLHDLNYVIYDILFTSPMNDRSHDKFKQTKAMFEICLNLGLVDRAMQFMCDDASVEVEHAQQLPIKIEQAIINAYRNSLDQIDTHLQEETLEKIHRRMCLFEDKELATNVITTVILSMTVFLLKFDTNDKEPNIYNKSALEKIFTYLKIYLDKFAFQISDLLIRSTKYLTLAIRNNLDALSDSEIMRESFRQLIDVIAGKCMIEGNYKSAAMLYSHIEDNVSAVKSLMRTGEVETVINYALLVKDFTVTRITINYLKHIKVDSSILEEFIAQSQA